MKRTAIVVLLAASAGSGLVFSACGGDDDAVGGGGADSGTGNEVSSSSSGSSGSTGDAGTTSCAAFADAVCNRQERCAPLGVGLTFGNVESCKESYEIICNRMTTAPGARPFSAACIAAYAAPDCNDEAAAAACSGDKGTLTEGTPCEFDGQCASGRCGSAGGTPGCGLCKAASDASASRTPEGGSCNNEGKCQYGLACLDAGNNGIDPAMGTCEKKREIGEACLDAEDCNTGTYGDLGWTGFSVACIDGGCAKPLDEGASCRTLHSCDLRKELFCQVSAVDGSLAGTCTKWPFAKVNEPCTTSSQTVSGNCSGDLRCVPTAPDAGSNSPGTCVPKGTVGDPCAKDYECRFGLECPAGVCTLLPADYCK